MGHMGLNKKCISSQSSQHTFYQSQEYHLSKRTHAHTTHTRVTKRDSSSHRRTEMYARCLNFVTHGHVWPGPNSTLVIQKHLVWLVSRLSDLYLLSSMKCMRHLFVRRASVVQLARAICRLPLDTAKSLEERPGQSQHPRSLTTELGPFCLFNWRHVFPRHAQVQGRLRNRPGSTHCT